MAAMEDVLEVYHRPRDRNCPLVCVDESSKQLIKETRTRCLISRRMCSSSWTFSVTSSQAFRQTLCACQDPEGDR